MRLKLGRPTMCPKEKQIGVRFDADTLELLDAFCENANISRAEGVRMAVQKLGDYYIKGGSIMRAEETKKIAVEAAKAIIDKYINEAAKKGANFVQIPEGVAWNADLEEKLAKEGYKAGDRNISWE